MLEKVYKQKLQELNLEFDESQLNLIKQLEKYLTHFHDVKSKNLLSKLSAFFTAKNSQPHLGVYIWGEVGRGKSMIMNLFFDSIEIAGKLKIHFHEFMLSFHKKVEALRKKHVKDPILKVAQELADKYKVICLDELQINNIADAMVVGRLFEALFKHEVFVFITSNRYPDELFKDGLQRERFIPFIELIKKQLEVYNLNNFKDYRCEKIAHIKKTYLYPINKENKSTIENIILELTGHTRLLSKQVTVDENKMLTVNNSYGNLAMFTFSELCEIPLGAIDYLALTKSFTTIILINIPKFTPDHHNEALRFITLIDCLYENKVKLICLAEASIDNLYAKGKNHFEFARTISRLKEMQSHEYLSASLKEVAA
jgi:cell division protein ZapE